MKSLAIIGLLSAIVLTSASDIYSTGPYNVKSEFYIGLFNWGLDHNVNVWAPDAPGEFPVIYFITGLAGIIPAEAYATVAERIASHGFVVLGIWTISFPTSQYDAVWLKDVDLWLQDNLNRKLVNDGFHKDLVIDFSKIYLMSHSSGAHVAINYLKLENGCENIRGNILLSPVDGMDPFGLIDEYCIEPGKKLNFQTPTLLLPVGLDSKPGIGEEGGIFPACAPSDLSNLRFWNALNGEAWLVNATSYGHGDVLVDFMADDIMQTVKACASNDSPLPIYHDFLSGTIVAFMKVTEGDCESAIFLEDTELMPVEVNVRKQTTFEATCLRGGYCYRI